MADDDQPLTKYGSRLGVASTPQQQEQEFAKDFLMVILIGKTHQENPEKSGRFFG